MSRDGCSSAEDSYTAQVHADAVVAGASLPYLAYTGPASPDSPAAPRALARAYCSELLLRYAAWAVRQLPPGVFPLQLAYRERRHPRLHRMLFEQVALPSVVWEASAPPASTIHTQALRG